MPLSLRNAIHSWISTFSPTEYCLPNRSKDDSEETGENDVENEVIETENYTVKEREKNTCVYEYLQHFLELSKKDLPLEDEIQSAALSLLNVLEPYCACVSLPCGEKIFIRPILPTDMVVMKNYIESGDISQHSLSLRFNSVVTKVLDSSLEYLCSVNFDTHFAIGVQIEENGKWKGIASGRFIQDETSPNEAEWAALVVDEKHGHKIGTCILYYLSVLAKRFGIEKLMAVVHPENYCVRYWMNKLHGYREYKNDCDFWVFDTPIYPEWIPHEETRAELEKGALGENVLSDELKELLVENIMQLLTYKKADSYNLSMLNSRKT